MKKNCLLVFVKEPFPGRVKTRLALAVGEKTACDIYISFLEQIGNLWTGNFDQICFIAKTTDSQDVLNSSRLKKYFPKAVHFPEQSPGDLGAKFSHAFHWAEKQGYTKIVLVGSDSPDLPLDTLSQAFQALDTVSTVIGPTYDGGYYLIGKNGVFPKGFFDSLPWSTETVYKETLQRFANFKLDFYTLPSWWDIDNFADYQAYLTRSKNTETHT